MHWIFQFIVRHSAGSLLVLTMLLSLWMLGANGPRQARIGRALLMSVFYPLQFTLSLSTNVKNIFAENKKLRTRVVQLTTELARYREQAAENERLRSLVDFSDSVSFDLLPVRVVLREPAQTYRSIAINAGAKNGVLLSMPVTAGSGVVGKVMQVLPHMSVVQLLQDPACRISVMVQKSRGVGIMMTENGHDFFFKCRSHIPVARGDRIVTSGLGGVYPRGLDVGEVISLVEDVNPLFKKIGVKPFADFDRLEEVFVVRVSPQWQAFRQEADSLHFEE